MEINTKSHLRKQYKKFRSKFSKKEIDLLSEDIAKKLLENFELSNKRIHVFISIEHLLEVNTQLLIAKLLRINSEIGTSLYIENTIETSHVKINKSTKFFLGDMKIPNPISSDILDIKTFDYIIIPLLAYDQNGVRLGYGKGIYDQILMNCKKNCIKIGISLFKPEKIIPTESHDIPLDFCQTPQVLYSFN